MLFVANGRLHTTAQTPLVLVRRRAPVTCALCSVICVAHGLSFALATPKPRCRGNQKVIIHPSWLLLDSVMEVCVRRFFYRGSFEDLRHNPWAVKELVEEMDLKPKLEKRMLAALAAIRDNQASET
jgi:hypothetical protein